jgi:hypothetical protein
MAYEQQQRPPSPLTIFDVMSNWLFADPVQGSNKRPNIKIKPMGNVPRIIVKTNVEGDRNNGRIDFNTDLATFSAAMQTLKQMAEGRALQDLYNFDYTDDFVAGKKLDKPMLLSTLQLGRDKDTGRLYMAIIAHQRPRIQFFFGPSKFHGVRLRDGSPLPGDQLSNAYALGFLEPACAMLYNLLSGSAFDENAKNVAKPPAMQGGNGGGGGGNYGGNRGGGGNSYGGGNRQGGNSYGGGGGNSAPSPMAEDFGDIPAF